MTESPRIQYRFDLSDGSQKLFDFWFDAIDFRLTNPAPAEPPFWTALGFNQCANCPLNARDTPHCPPALQMADAVERLAGLVSYDTVAVTVVQPGRTVSAEISAQQALSLGDGPHHGDRWLSVDRPAAPDGAIPSAFRGRAETVYRIVTMYLLARELHGSTPAAGFERSSVLYENLHLVNHAMCEATGRRDAHRSGTQCDGPSR